MVFSNIQEKIIQCFYLCKRKSNASNGEKMEAMNRMPFLSIKEPSVQMCPRSVSLHGLNSWDIKAKWAPIKHYWGGDVVENLNLLGFDLLG